MKQKDIYLLESLCSVIIFIAQSLMKLTFNSRLHLLQHVQQLFLEQWQNVATLTPI